MMKLFPSATIALGLVALIGCAQNPAHEPQSPSPPAHDAAGAVQAIRAAGKGLDSAVQVQPLRDPAIEGFLAAAAKAEAAGKIDEAIAQAGKALALAPDAPDILQTLAELEVARGDWIKAEQYAVKSYEQGPRIGSLCARNWQTVVEARIALHDTATVVQARKRLAQCRVEPRVRM